MLKRGCHSSTILNLFKEPSCLQPLKRGPTVLPWVLFPMAIITILKHLPPLQFQIKSVDEGGVFAGLTSRSTTVRGQPISPLGCHVQYGRLCRWQLLWVGLHTVDWVTCGNSDQGCHGVICLRKTGGYAASPVCSILCACFLRLRKSQLYHQ